MSVRNVQKRHKWALDFSRHKQDGARSAVAADSQLDPPGFCQGHSQPSSDARQDNSSLIEKKSWDIALGPLKQLPMNLFIMWMAGNSISIFPIMMVGMMFIRPIQAFLSIQHTFNMIEGKRKALQQVVYTFGNIVGLGLAVYKCQVMGLLPTHPSDWLAFVEPQKIGRNKKKAIGLLDRSQTETPCSEAMQAILGVENSFRNQFLNDEPRTNWAARHDDNE